VSALFIITRLDPRDDVLEAEAWALGYEVVRESLLVTEPGVDATWLADRIAAIPDGTGLAWTSRRAAHALALTLPREYLKLKGMPLYAVGEESAAPLRLENLSPHTPGEGKGAAELADFIAERAAADGVRRVIFLHGNRSLPDLPEGLKARGIDVEFLEVYKTRFVTADLSGLEVALQESSPIMAAFFSPSGVEALERFLTPDARVRFRERAAAMAKGPTTARALEQRGYRTVLVPERTVPFDRYLKEALHSPSGERP
jgi:uroporphyrinogen-III synthase